MNQFLKLKIPTLFKVIIFILFSLNPVLAGTPTSSLEPAAKVIQALGVTSGSEQSDGESMEIECGPFEQSTAVTDIKRMRSAAQQRR